jgi:hypothetical protein
VQRRVGLVECRALVAFRVVQQHQVDPVEPEPVQAGGQRAAYPVGAEVPHPPVVGGHRETVRVRLVRGSGRRHE